MNVSFYPGPSKVYEQVPSFVNAAHKQGILSVNHRSEPFMKMVKQCQKLLRKKLEIPQDYSIFFTSSATESWEIIAQSLTREQSFHIYNGSFGEKWFHYTKKLKPKSTALTFDPGAPLNIQKLRVPIKAEVVCLTQNETSNGTQVTNKILSDIRKKYPRKVLAVDVTSSMAGVFLDFNQADLWFASVQKCFGLPAGLGLLVCSPRALAEAKKIGENDHYNSLLFMQENMEKYQTSYTPNVLSIYLLMKVMKTVPGIRKVDEKTQHRHHQWMDFLNDLHGLRPLIRRKTVQSHTVIALAGKADMIAKIKKQLHKAGFIVGNGYGNLKETTLRIANFPAIKDKEIKGLQKGLQKILSYKP